MAKCLTAKTFKLKSDKSYGNGSDIEAFAGNTDIRKLVGNNLMAKHKVL